MELTYFKGGNFGLAIREKALGPDHPDVGDSLNRLATLYAFQARPAEAESFSRRSLLIREKALGPNHPEVARSLSTLARLASARGDLNEAESLEQRSLAILEMSLGPEHPRIASNLEDYASLLRRTKREGEAKEMGARARAIRAKHAQENSLVPPKLRSRVDPDYSEEARMARIEGTVELYIEIGTDGRPQQVWVRRGLGLGLDEKAVNAVRRWKFQPTLKNGVAVAAGARVTVHFRLRR